MLFNVSLRRKSTPMSTIVETITQELGGDTVASLGKAVGASPQQTQAMLGAALPALISGLAKNTSNPSGAQALADALDRDHAPNLMDQLGPLASQLAGGGGGGLAGMLGGLLGGGQKSSGAGGLGSLLPMALDMMQGQQGKDLPKALNGAGILGHIFGGKGDKVAQTAAQASGVDASMMLKFLPMLAPIVMSALGTVKSNKSLDAQGLSDTLRGESAGLGVPSADGFGVDDLMKVGGALAQSGMLGKLFS